MSGGSWDYLTFKVDEAADRLCASECPLRRAFGKHVRLVGKALYDIEWVDSGDKSNGDERSAIELVLGQSSKALEIIEARADAEKSIERLQKLLSQP